MAARTAAKIEKVPSKGTTVGKTVARTNRGRKPEALKPIMENAAPTKRYRTRKDYNGEGWTKALESATPRALKFEQSESVKEVRRRITKPKDPPVSATKIVKRATKVMGNDQPLAAEFAYNLMDLCSKYIFVLRNAYGDNDDGVTEIDIHIKVKPTSTFSGGMVC